MSTIKNLEIHTQRVRDLNRAPINPDGDAVLYWMVASRRLSHNFGLQRAAFWATELGKPLWVLEALRLDYPHASARLHRFVLDGMAEHAARLAHGPVRYHPFVERQAGQGKGLLAALAGRSCVVVTDDYPTFFVPNMLRAAARTLPVRLEAVDASGVLPMAATDRAYPTAYAFRRVVQKEILAHLGAPPLADPLAAADLVPAPALPEEITARWPAAGDLLDIKSNSFSGLSFDHQVDPVDLVGGTAAGMKRWARFLTFGLPRYAGVRHHPDETVTSGLSPYLHFGHVSSFALVRQLLEHEGWDPQQITPPHNGRRAGWWGLSEDAEAFLDQIVTWRELGFNGCFHRPDDHMAYSSLPDWAQKTLADHRADPRPYLYSHEQFERAHTHDPLWNAAQTQLLREGTIHNYLRMLWGKQILKWSVSPQKALDTMIRLNDRYALDGRDPNSYSGIFWVLGRHDRAWGPERDVVGKVRYMTSKSARTKLRLKGYLKKYGGDS